MTITLVANISANGKVLLSENKHHHAPQEASASFIQVAMEAGNLILGRKTLEFIEQLPEAARGFLSDLEIVLLSGTVQHAGAYKVVNSPQEAISYLQAKGFNTIAIGGGTKTYNAFLNANLVTDIYFNIIPVITGNGGELGTNANLESTFKLKAHKLLSDQIVQIHLVKE
ncbi:Dihydrofolate reductase [Chitinophaga jiangningensis]|uniref:Dihydrofolate reductase n=1 Tax=Chitinophaga jiangningensis TaxID=1419482 RepID=A0A1M6Y6S7_9BACT|nr:dihydrofolate reductase family protein [Chitinophaga jiangningensis]SHL13956.1 Dihydrofolate reductase [Chitinophaga jiangningensis]